VYQLGGLFSIPTSGGNPIQLPNAGPANYIAVGGAFAYWADGSAVRRAPVDGSATPTVLATVGNREEIFGLAVDSTSVYFAVGSLDSPGAIKTVPITGGTPTVIATSTWPLQVAVDGAYVYWTNAAQVTRGPSCDTSLMRVALGGGVPEVLASGQMGATYLALDANFVYWTNTFEGTVVKLAK
jgi:hypothetical protein